ncbi:MAG TPA: carboxymuconolactone decarboxylase family protein [Candidatus Deferrimicrobiaceae bacterium]|jgi:4-carboxymuconolactone decarboxylase
MAISEAANRNHDALFPNHKSTLKVTDPELIELFDNFAFDEVLRHGTLDAMTRLIVILGSMIASQALGEYKVMLGGALNIGVTPVEVKEIVYQAVPYVGIAKVYDFIHATNEILAGRGIKLPLEGQSTTTPETRRAKGLELQKAIFGDLIDRMYRDSPPDQLHIQEYLSANCFGDYLTRTGLEIGTRELLTFSMILSLGGCESQLKGHIQGNINVGNGKELLLDVVTQLLPYVGYPRALNAIGCINEAGNAPVPGEGTEDPQAIRITRSGVQPSTQGPDEYFTGSVRVTMLVNPTGPARTSVGRVTFEPGARTAWHTHPFGQTLIVTEGVGRIQRWGGPVEEIRPGDVVSIPFGTKHWHGASNDSAMTHLAIQEHLDGKAAEWMEKVSD